MPKKPNSSSDPTEQRRRAEEQANARRTESQSEADPLRLLHELQVHQIEMEMQNTELQEARSALEQALEKYTDLYNFAPVGYLTLDAEGTIHEANLAAAALLGLDRSALAQRRFDLFVDPGDLPAFRAFLGKAFASQVRQGCELTLRGERRPPLVAALDGMAIASGSECRVTLTDLTERKRAEADRLVLNKLESTGILAAGIAHDFNNLLTVILLNLELAQTIDPPDTQWARHLEDAKQTTLLARNLTAQLVTFAQGGPPIRQPLILADVIEPIIRPALSGSNVRCEFSLAEDLWMTEGDEGQISQVLRNLALNAREAMAQGGVVSVRAQNVVLGDQDQPHLPAGEFVQLSIADQGAGIAKEILPKIFDPYFSTKQRGTQKGMGLGLTLCHAIIQKHKGAITVDSTPGVGTTFQIYLPKAREILGQKESSARPAALGPCRILIMDDEPAMRKALAITLGKLGHEVELAEDGQAAVEIFEKAKREGRAFDAVILDLTVPGGMGGKEAIQKLLRLDPAIKAVLMSGYANEPVLLDYERHGFKGALTKPFRLGRLEELLSRVLTN